MSPHPYTEDQLVEQPAIALLAELGWTTVNALDEVLGLDGTFGRETKSDVVLAAHLRAALVRLNPAAPAEAITAAIDQLVVNRSAMSLVAANREVYLLLKEGVPVSVREPERGGQRTLRVRIIDWENTSNNDFLFVSQFSITGSLYTWTQGSGKSLAMVFFAQKVLRRVPGNWTFVVVTDRTELDGQIARTFKETGAVSDADSKSCHAGSGAHLRQLLTENHRYVFTLIHKFQTPEVLCDRRDIVVLTDEAHRSQYDTLALNMRSALPNALFIAFTGTPLIAGEERTREVFGDYVSIYDFQQSVEDGATVRLFYENRTPELRLQNPTLNDDIYALVEAAELDEDQERRLEQELGRQYHLITRDDRLDTIAKDIVRHFLGRGFQGKAMVVSIDKATALRVHDKVQTHWQAERTRVETELAKARSYESKLDPGAVADLEDRLRVLSTTDMALVVSPAQNEIEQMRQLGLDIAPHRKRMNDEALDDKFKDPDDPLRLVFVCAMWLTGFDAPSCSTIYLDKPMRNHTLMQTVAREPRVPRQAQRSHRRLLERPCLAREGPGHLR
jgi:type I restriction enzyme R subunit